MRIIEIEHDLDHFIISQDDGVISYSERGYGDEVEIPLKSLSSSSSSRILHGVEILMCHKWPVRQLSGEGCRIPGENFYKALGT